jgi:membrane protein
VGLASSTEWLLAIGRWPVLLAGISLGLALIYRYGPSRDQAKWKWVTPGSIVAAVLWIVVSMLFSWYAANFGSYNETYGSLGAVIGFMTWIWLSSIIVLLGAEINAEMEHQTAKDTTKGPDRPMGARGATMADNLGAAKV